MRIDVGSIIETLHTAIIMNGRVYVRHERKLILLADYINKLEVAHQAPNQSILLNHTATELRVVEHRAGNDSE
jgi:hypothetical protein